MADFVQPDAEGESVTRADRLTLVSEVGWLYFEPPIFVQAGECFWVNDRTLYVRSTDREVRSVEARASRPTDRR
ncbi:MAG TPA: hypothetical protein DCR14_17730 [Acidimicrobiaceae bacterium]|nr:hypothetical protein [Acidimicrobiaceae bacterium]